MVSGRCIVTVAAFAAMMLSGSAAWADIFDIGSTFTIGGTNAPNTFGQTVTLSPGTTTIDGGALTLTQQIVDQSSGEWLILTVQATGSDIYSSTDADWSIFASGIDLTELSNGIAFYLDWGTNGVLANPTTGFGSIPLLGTNPITGSGNVFGGLLNGSADGITQWPTPTGALLDPFGIINDSGIAPPGLNEFQDAIEVAAAPVPEPSSLVMLAVGIAGFAALRRRRRRA